MKCQFKSQRIYVEGSSRGCSVQCEKLMLAAFFLQHLYALIPFFEDYQNTAFIQLLAGIKEGDFRFLITLTLLKAHCVYLYAQRKWFQTTTKKFIKEMKGNIFNAILGIKKVLLEMKGSLPLPCNAMTFGIYLSVVMKLR